MKRVQHDSSVYQPLLSVHTLGCSDSSLDELAASLLRYCGFGGVLIMLGTGEPSRTGRAGSRGALRTLHSRAPQAAEGQARTSGAVRSWPVTDPTGAPAGQLHCLLGRDGLAPDAGQLQLIEQVCQQLGVAFGQWQQAEQARTLRQELFDERTERRQVERALGLVFDESAIGMATVSLAGEAAGRFLAVNDALCHLTGRSAEELLRLTSAELTHQDDRAIGNSAMRRAMAGRRTPVRYRRRLLRADGSAVWVQVTTCPLFDDEDRPLYALQQIEDLRAREDAESELAARQDPLTGVLNSAALEESMVEVLDRARRLDTTGAVLVCDLGPLADAPDQAENIRRTVASTLGRTLRNGDIIARVAENRFAIVAEEVRPEHAASLARRITEAMRGSSQQTGSIDIGISVLSPDADPQVLFRQATEAMLTARETGQSYLLYQRSEVAEPYPSEVLYARPGWRAGD
ncbi:MAG: PAS domain S-box protein [Actinomycetota bacterium]|nr:PAS domain S-box protein [Actinomycetota bacterium]MDQ2958220.1 PAS domain S-box protein [Actinomycetota bacterium]